MADVLARWVASRGWYSPVLHDDEAERDQVRIGLAIATVRARLTIVHDVAGAYVRAAIIPTVNLDSWKIDQAHQLIEAIGDPSIRAFRDVAGYWKLGARVLRRLDDQEDAIAVIDGAVDQVIQTWTSWSEELWTFCTTNATVSSIVEGRAGRPHDQPKPSWQLIVDHEEFERRLERHREETPCPATSFTAALHWAEDQRDELRQSLIAQGFIVD